MPAEAKVYNHGGCSNGCSMETPKMSNANPQTTDAQTFDSRSLDHEAAWLTQDVNRVLGTELTENDDIDEGDTSNPVVAWYKFFYMVKKDLLKNSDSIDTGSRSVNAYREQFAEPDEETWTDDITEFLGERLPHVDTLSADTFPITGVVKVPADAALERIGIDYDNTNVQPIYLPEVGGDVFDPTGRLDGVDFSEPQADEAEVEVDAAEDLPPWEQPDEPSADSDEAEAESEVEMEEANDADAGSAAIDRMSSADASEQQVDESADESEVTDEGSPEEVMDFDNLTIRTEVDDSTLHQWSNPDVATYVKLRDPTLSLSDVGETVAAYSDRDSYSSTSVGNSLKSRLGEDGYDRLKAKADELRHTESEESIEAGEQAVEDAVEAVESDDEGQESEPAPSPTQSGEAFADLAETLDPENENINLTSVLIGATARLANEGREESIRTLYTALSKVPEE